MSIPRALPAILLAFAAVAAGAAPELTIPSVAATPTKRLITVDDVMALRKVAQLKVSPDGSRYAVFVRQADVARNTYRSAWFVGDVSGGPLTHVADGGELRFLILPDGGASGDLDQPQVQWSPDGEWIAYTLQRAGEVQLWRSKADGKVVEQLSRNASDVMGFAWSDDGKKVFFTAGATRAEVQAQAERRERSGYRYNEDLYSIFDLMTPRLRAPVNTKPRVWLVDLQSHEERPASEAEQAEFKRARDRDLAGREAIASLWLDAAIPPVANARGDLVGLKRAAAGSLDMHLVFTNAAGENSRSR
jgi:hypothetical protein